MKIAEFRKIFNAIFSILLIDFYLIKYIDVGTVVESQKLNAPISLASFFSLGILIKYELYMRKKKNKTSREIPSSRNLYFPKADGSVLQQLQSLLLKMPTTDQPLI